MFRQRDSGFTEEEETEEYDDTGRGKSRVSDFSRGERAVHRSALGISMTTSRPLKCSGEFFKAVLGLFVQFGGVFYVDHVRFHLGHPYIRASTDALIVNSIKGMLDIHFHFSNVGIMLQHFVSCIIYIRTGRMGFNHCLNIFVCEQMEFHLMVLLGMLQSLLKLV